MRSTASSRPSSAVLLLFAALALGLAATPRASGAATPQQRLVEARRGARIAAIRAERLAAAASQERDAAERAKAEARAMAARIDATRADIAAARIRLAILEQLLTEQRAALGVVQSPIARLLAALQSLARRPTIVAVAQPGSVDDLVHVRAVLGTALPAVRLRADAVRTALRRTRRLQTGAAQAARALRDGRIRLEAQRVALAKLEATHRRRSQALGRGAIGESDRAIALGERARDLVDSLAESGSAEATALDLAALAGPVPRPLAPGSIPAARVRGAYRLPVRGRLVTGFDAVSDVGVRSRGLTFAVAPDARVVAPAAGIVRYARAFRGYGRIVILDHGDGWTTLLTGLADTGVKPGVHVAAGSRIGTAPGGEDPLITVELRRRGRPVDAAALIG